MKWIMTTLLMRTLTSPRGGPPAVDGGQLLAFAWATGLDLGPAGLDTVPCLTTPG